jgi:hypothetical protein
MFDAKNLRKADAVPAFRVSVPMVWSALNVTDVMPTVPRPAKDRVLNVFAPVIVVIVAAVAVKLKLLNVKPPLERVGLLPPVIEIVEVPALKVKLVIVVSVTAVLAT